MRSGFLWSHDSSRRISIDEGSDANGGKMAFCGRCGNKLSGNSKFCSGCGAPVLGASKPQSDQHQQRAKPTATAGGPKPPGARKTRRRWLMAAGSALLLILAVVGVQRITSGGSKPSPTADDVWLVSDQMLYKPTWQYSTPDDSNGIYLGRFDESGNLMAGTRLGGGALATWSETGNRETGSFTFAGNDDSRLVAIAGEATSSILRVEEPESQAPVITTVATVPGTAQHIRRISGDAFGITSVVTSSDDDTSVKCLRLNDDGTQSDVATGQDCRFAADGSALVKDSDDDSEQTTYTRFAPDGTQTSAIMPGYPVELEADSALVATTSDGKLWVNNIDSGEVLIDGQDTGLNDSWLLDSDIDSAGNSRILYAVDTGDEYLEIKMISSDGNQVTVASGVTATGFLLDDGRAWLAIADAHGVPTALREYPLTGEGALRDIYTASSGDVSMSFARVDSGGGLLVLSPKDSETVTVHSLSIDGVADPSGTTVATQSGRFLHAGDAIATALYEEGNGDTQGNAALAWLGPQSGAPTAVTQASAVDLIGVAADGTVYFSGGLRTADDEYRNVLLSTRPGEQPKIVHTIADGYFGNAWPTPFGLVFTVNDWDSEDEESTSYSSVLTTDESGASSARPLLSSGAVVNAPVTGWLAQTVEDASGFPVEAYVDEVAKQCETMGIRILEAPLSAPGSWTRDESETQLCMTIPRDGSYELELQSSQVDDLYFSFEDEFGDETSGSSYFGSATLEDQYLFRGSYVVTLHRSEFESGSPARFTFSVDSTE